MKKIIILLLILAFIAPMAYAETQIFSGTVITNQDKVIDGNLFRFAYDDASNKTFVQTPAQNLIVKNNECNSNGAFRVCINSADYYDRNITTYETYYQLGVTISKLTGSLTTASASTNSNLLQGESANITITIKNPTDLDVSNIAYEENLTNFTILNINGCTLKGDKISWSGSLQSGYNKVCTVWVVAQQKGNYNFIGSLSYFNGFEKETKATDTLAINVLPEQLAVSQLVDENVEIEQPFYLIVTLQNINPTENIDLSIDINVPRNFMLLKKPEGFSQDIGALRSDSRIEAGSSFNYSLYLKADAESKIPITQVFNYKIKGLQYTIENDTFIKAPEPKPLINLTAEHTELAPGQNFIVVAQLRNPSKIYELTDIKAKLTSPDNSDVEQKLNKLMPNEQYTIISSTLTAPKNLDLANNNILLNLTIDYKFNDIAKSTSSSLALKLKSGNATIGNITTKENVQSNAETNIKNTSTEVSLGNKTTKTTETKIENPKPQFLNRNVLVYGIEAFVVFFIAAFIISRIRKRKKPDTSLEEKALSEIKEVINK